MSDRNARSSVSPETPQPTGSEDSGIAALVVIAQLSGVAVSAERLRNLSGLKVRSTASQINRLAQTPLPAVSELRDYRFLVVTKCANDNVLLCDEVQRRTFKISLAESEQPVICQHYKLATEHMKDSAPSRPS
ncbi:hypothetical protein NUH87_13545 [Pseudomonas batumici]|uniref:hypothetical protein n=1 Tax=Pseudomonas batumici TaxID=226910 RepID=UPI0030D092CD